MYSLEKLKEKYDFGIVNVEDYLRYKPIKEDWVKSIIIFIFPYQYKKEQTEKYPPARFAYGKDYHLVVRNELEEVAKLLELSKYQVMVDVSFLDEKLCASLAGLGTIGKNTLLITPKYGTFVVIGEIVTDQVFSHYDKPIESLCIDCDLCVKKCPTKALDNGFERSQCLSHLTQSASNNFDLYDKIKDLAFGCDICQEVCPHNKKNHDFSKEFNFNQKSVINLNILKTLNKKTYLDYYADKNFNWIGYLKMLRNIIVLEANNNNISLYEINYFQNLYKNVSWFNEHMDYLKGKINNGN